MLGTAWPKGKRAAFRGEMRSRGCESSDSLLRSVVTKDDESEGTTRLRRIAAEAAKQSGRNELTRINPELKFEEFRRLPQSRRRSCVPEAPDNIAAIVSSKAKSVEELALIIGPKAGSRRPKLVR
jgi:RsmE family RNA methyltransferase